MTGYRIKLLASVMADEQEFALECLTDAAAVNDAAFLGHGGQIEIWEGTRLVGRFIGLPGLASPAHRID